MLRWIIMQNDLIYRLSAFKYVDLIANQYDKQVRNYWAKISKSKIQYIYFKLILLVKF